MNPVAAATSPISSVSFARRRHQARLRQSLREIEKEENPGSSKASWITTSERSQLMCHSGIELVSKRREANARERLRVRNLNSGFAKLRRILPTVPPNRKPSKVDTLQGAIDYIYQLERVLDASGGIPNIKKILGTTSHTHSRQSVTERPFFDDASADFAPVTTVRYAPPFNRFDTPNCCSRAGESTSPPSAYVLSTQSYAGVNYLTIPSSGNDFVKAYSNGFPSPASSVASEESVNFLQGCTDNITDGYHRHHPPNRRSSPRQLISGDSATYSTSDAVRSSWEKNSGTTPVESSTGSNERNDTRIRHAFHDYPRRWSEEKGVSRNGFQNLTSPEADQSNLPPVSYLCGGRVTVYT